MQIGILVTGHVHEDLVPRHGTYPAMFEALLGAAAPELVFRSWDVAREEWPDTTDAADCWLITGSRHGVYEDLPWIAWLREFLARARRDDVPILGVCFGHQILAEALGGSAAKSERGWGVGLGRYSVLHKPTWMEDAPDEIAIHAMHQDQVTGISGDATVLAGNDHCPFAMLAYGDPETPDAISIQPHPEFGEPYARDLVAIRSGISFPPETAETAMATFGPRTHAADFARWSAAWLRRVRAARRAA